MPSPGAIVGIGLAVLDADGNAMLAEAPRRLDDARLRRVQARASDEQVGLDIAARLLGAKLLGQANLVRRGSPMRTRRSRSRTLPRHWARLRRSTTAVG